MLETKSFQGWIGRADIILLQAASSARSLWYINLQLGFKNIQSKDSPIDTCCARSKCLVAGGTASTVTFGTSTKIWMAYESCLLCTLMDIYSWDTWIIVSWTQVLNPSKAEAYRIEFWMMKHGSLTPKPTELYSNMIEIKNLDLGTLTKEERNKSETKLVRRFSLNMQYAHAMTKLELCRQPSN